MSQLTDMVTSRRCRFILLATPGSEGTRYRLRYGNQFIWLFPFLKFHNNINKKRKVSVCDKLKIRVRKRETKHAIFTEIQIFGIFFSLG